MITDFYIKQGDTLEQFVTILTYADGTPITRDLTGASIRIHVATFSGSVLVSAACSLISNTTKEIGYQWVVGDTAVASTDAQPHQLEIEVTYADGNVETFPNTKNIKLHVFPQVA